MDNQNEKNNFINCLSELLTHLNEKHNSNIEYEIKISLTNLLDQIEQILSINKIQDWIDIHSNLFSKNNQIQIKDILKLLENENILSLKTLQVPEIWFKLGILDSKLNWFYSERFFGKVIELDHNRKLTNFARSAIIKTQARDDEYWD